MRFELVNLYRNMSIEGYQLISAESTIWFLLILMLILDVYWIKNKIFINMHYSFSFVK